jgi:hypothetical protein
MAEDTKQVNVSMGNEVVSMLDALVADDSKVTGLDMDRSKIVRRLIRQEFDRRSQTGTIITELPGPEDANRPMLVVNPCGDSHMVEA